MPWQNIFSFELVDIQIGALFIDNILFSVDAA